MSGGVATVGRLAVSITGDVDDLKTSMAEAQSVVGAAAKDMAVSVSTVSDETDKVTAAGKRMVAQLQEEVRTFGMSREEILIYKASLTGAGAEVERLVGQLQALKAAQAAAPQLAADAQATQRIRDMVAASLAQQAAMVGTAEAVQTLTTAEAGAARVSASWAESQRLQAQNMAGVAASMKSATEGTAALSAQTQIILNRYDPLGTKLRSLQSDLAILRKEMGDSVDPGAMRAFQGLESEIEKTRALMTKAGVEGFGAMEGGAKKSALATAGATRELLVLGHEVISGNFAKMPGSFLILAQRMEMLPTLLSGASLGFVGLAAAAAGTVALMAKGAEEQREMANAIAVTGDYAGQTSQSLNQLAESMTQTHEVTIGTAKDIVLALTASGRIGGAAINTISRFVSDFAKSTGQAVDEVAPKMISLFEDPARGAEELNRSMHFLTVTQLEHIATLQRQGDVQKAQDELARAAADHMPKQAQDIGYVTQAINVEVDAWSKLIDKIKEWGKTYENDPSKRAQILRDDISDLMARGVPRSDPRIKAIQERIDALEPAIQKQKELAQAEKDAAAANEVQAKSWDAVKASSSSYHIQALQDQLTLMQKLEPKNAAQAGFQADAIRQINDQIAAAYRAMGAEGRQLLQQQITGEEQLALLKLKGAADDANNQLKLGTIDKQQFDMKMTNNALDVNSEQQLFELRMANLGGLTDAERQAHLNKLAQLKQEREQIEANGAAAVDIDAKKAFDEQMKAIVDAGAAEVKSLDEAIAKQKEHNAEIGKTKDQIELARQAQTAASTGDMEREAQAIDALLNQEDMQGILIGQDRDLYAARLAYLNTEIEKRKELAALLGDGAVKEADAKAAADAAAAWKRSANTIENDLTNAILDGGGRGWKKLVRDMEMAFAKLVLQPILEPISGSLATTLSPFMGNQTIGASAAPSAAGAAGAVGAAQTAANLYKAITNGFSSLSDSVAGAVQTGLNSLGYTPMASQGLATASGQALTPLASFAGQAAGTCGGYALGSGLNSAISGKYSTGSGFEDVEKIATAVASAYFGPIGGAVAGAISGLVNRAFGHGPTQVQSQGLTGTLTATSLTGDSYQNLHKDGGWFTSDKNWQTTTAFTTQMVAQFTQGLASIESASSGFAHELGVSADSITSYSKAFDIKLTGDQSKDQQAITDFFNGVGDEIAKQLVPSLEQFSKTGETAAATLQRLAGDFQGTTQAAQLLGTSAAHLFGSAGLDSATARENLINAAGGLSALSQEAQSFNQNFLTATERLAPVQQALAAALASLGEASLQTRDDFKAAVEGLIDSGATATSAGAQKLAQLLALTDAFNQVHPDTSAADAQKASDMLQQRQQLQDQLDQLTMTSTQLLKKQRDALDESNRALFDQVQAAQAAKDAVQAQADAIKAVQDNASSMLGNVDNAYSVLDKVVGREKAALQMRIDAETAAVNKLQSLSQSIHSALDSFNDPGSASIMRQMAQAQIRNAVAIVQGGGSLSDAQTSALTKAFSTVSKDATAQFATYDDYLRDQYQTQNDIAALGTATDHQLSVQQQMLDADKAQLQKWDDMLTAAQEQVDQLKGISTVGLSIEQALAGLQLAIVSAQQNPVVAATSAINTAYQTALGRAPDQSGLAFWQGKAAEGVSTADITKAISQSPEAMIEGMYETMLHRHSDASGMQFWLGQYGKGVSLSDIGNAMANSAEAKGKLPGFAAGGDFGGGWRIVGENGPELEATGPARIFSAQQTSSLLSRLTSQSSNNDALVAEVKALRSAVERLEQKNSAENVAQVKQQQSTNDLLTRVIYGGDAIQTKAAS